MLITYARSIQPVIRTIDGYPDYDMIKSIGSWQSLIGSVPASPSH